MKKFIMSLLLLLIFFPLTSLEPFFSFGPNILLNTKDTIKGAPSPVMFSFGGGVCIPFYKNFSTNPGVSFFTNYYLWNNTDQYAYPAEIENRTALVFSMLTELPITYSINIGKQHFFFGTGLAILARLGIIALGVDSGTSGSAEDDIEAINHWFWSNARYLYPELCAGWNYKVNKNTTGGFYISYYLPLGSLLTENKLDASIIKIEARLYF